MNLWKPNKDVDERGSNGSQNTVEVSISSKCMLNNDCAIALQIVYGFNDFYNDSSYEEKLYFTIKHVVLVKLGSLVITNRVILNSSMLDRYLNYATRF